MAITKNTDGTYTSDYWPQDPYWSTEEGQVYLKASYPLNKAFLTGEITTEEYQARMKEIRDLNTEGVDPDEYLSAISMEANQ